MFISSTAAHAGRRHPIAVFPYYTDDKIHDSADIMQQNSLNCPDSRRDQLWEPFSNRYRRSTTVATSTKTFMAQDIFEEINDDLA